MKSIGKHLAKNYSDQKIIDPKLNESYAYIFDYIINLICYNFSLLIIGYFAHSLISAIIYAIITGYIRAIAGGYHCKKRTTCFLLSYFVFASYLVFDSLNTIVPLPILLIQHCISWMLIIIVSPVDTTNNRFTNALRKTSLRKIYAFCGIDSVFTIFLVLLNYNRYIHSNNLCLLICSIGLYVGYFSNRRHQ